MLVSPTATIRRVEVVVARSEDEVAALRSQWLQLPVKQVHANPDFFLTVVRERPEVERPHVVAAINDGRPTALLAARLERVPLETRIGYRTVYRPTVRLLTVVHGGFVSTSGGRGLEVLQASIARSLRDGEADAIVFPSIQKDSPLFSTFSASAGRLRRQHFAESRIHRRLELPDTFDAFLASRSSKVRSGIKYDTRKLLLACGDELRVETLASIDDFDQIFRDIPAIANRTYQRALGASFADTLERRALVRLLLERGWFRSWVLYLKEEPIAFWQGTVYDGIYHSGTTGYDAEYRRHRVGIYLLMRLIEDLCSDPAVRYVDFGLGDADYKRQLCTESWEEQDLCVFAPTVRAISVNLSRSAVLAVGAGAKSAVERLGVAGRLKTHWRQRLAVPAREAAGTG